MEEFYDALMGTTHDAVTSSSKPEIKVVYDDSPDDPNLAQNVEYSEYLNITIRHTSDTQTSLTDNAGKQRFTSRGFMAIECRLPYNGGRQLTNTFCEELKNYLKKNQPAGVILRNCRVTEFGKFSNWFVSTIFCDFEYDQFV